MGINPWLEKKLSETRSPKTLNLLVEVHDSGRIPEVRSRLGAISGVTVGQSSFNMIAVTAPLEVVPQIAATPGVTVHYDAPVGIRQLPAGLFPAGFVPNPSTKTDPLIGQVSISAIEIPFTPQQMAARFLPNLAAGIATLPFQLLQQLTGVKTAAGSVQQKDVIIIPTGDVLKSLETPEDNKMVNTRVAVLDTGLTYPHPLLHPTKGLVQLGTFAGPVPFDGLGHGMWCGAAAWGDSYKTRFGLCKGVADPENGTLGSWKVLSDVGFGSNWSIIQGLEAAYKWGAKILSLSLGGELQGSVDDDPLCRVIAQLPEDVILVVAAGNEGPSGWTIGTPGASPRVVTVGAWSPYYNGLALFSSRGPNGKWYAQNGGTGHKDFARYGEDMIKPDIVAPGGGPVKEGQPMDLLYSGCSGWTDAMYDLTIDLFTPMRGTSMATPLAAGIVSLAYDRGYIRTAQDIKRKMARFKRKDASQGYGFITYSKLVG